MVVAGPTGTGKGSMAVSIARERNGEIVCIDSAKIYKKLDVGTAKPPVHIREEIPHHMIDLIEPRDEIASAKYTALASKAIDDIVSRGKLPIIVGGSFFYLKYLLFGKDGTAPPSTNQELLNSIIQQLNQDRQSMQEKKKNKKNQN